MAVFNACFHPVNFQPFVRAIEHVVGHHFERGQMTARTTDSVDVGQSNARLRDGQWIGRRVNRARGHVRLKISDGSDGEVNVITPASQHWIGVNTGVVSRLEKAEKRFSHGVLEGFSTLVKAGDQRSADEGIFVFGGITACVSLIIRGPKPKVGDPALLANVAVLVKHSKVNGRQGHQIISTR